jgi:hypothetical protein
MKASLSFFAAASMPKPTSAAGNRGRHGEMGEFLRIESDDVAAVDRAIPQQLFEGKPRSRAALAIDEARLAAHDVFDGADAFRILRRHHQSLPAFDEMDEPLQARLEPGLIGRGELGAEPALGDVEPGHVAARLAERHDTVEAADEAQIELGTGAAAQQIAQLRQDQVVARIDADRRLRLVEHPAQLLLDLGGGAFEMR